MIGLSNTDILKNDELNYEYLALPFHHLAVTGMDVCIRKPLIVTCGMDRSVRIWNYISKTIEVKSWFNEQPHSVAFHPSGFHILVGFSDSLRMMNILMNDLRVIKDFAIKSCKEVQFSNGGQYFAAANGSVIQIFATYTCDLLGSFNIHKSKIKNLQWLPDDSAILSAGMDGCVFITKIKDGTYSTILKQNKVTFHSAVYTASDNHVYIVGSDKTLKIVKDASELSEQMTGIGLTQLCTQVYRAGLKDRFLFAGTETGMVRVIPLPLEGKEAKNYDYLAHSAPITRVRVSFDDNYLFTVGEDGCLCIFQMEQKRGETSTSSASGNTAAGAAAAASSSSSASASGASSLNSSSSRRVDSSLPWAEEILVNRAEQAEELNLLQELENKVKELTQHNELQLQLREHTYREKLREVNERFNQELEADRQRYRSLEEEKEALEKAYSLKVDQLNSMQKQKLEELQLHHSQKIALEQERYSELEDKRKRMRAQWQEDLKLMEEKYSAEKMELQREFEEKIQEQRNLRQQLNHETEEIKKEMNSTTDSIEQDADEEIDELKHIYDKKLTQERMTTLRLKDQNAILKRKFSALQEDIKENLDDLLRMKDKQQALYDTIDALEKDIKGHVKEIKERESTIQDKRQRIFELKKKNQELEKFKFVLDYKITELKRQIQPRKQEMKELHEQLEEMEKELRRYKKEASDLELDVTELNLKLNGMEKNIHNERFNRDRILAKLSHFKTELHEVFADVEDPKKLKDGVKRLFQKFVQPREKEENSFQPTGNDNDGDSEEKQSGHGAGASNGLGLSNNSGVDDIHKDYQRQRHYLERSIDSHNAKCKKDMRVHMKEHTRIMSENIALTKEVNELRREKYNILVNQKQKDAMKKAAKKATTLTGNTIGTTSMSGFSRTTHDLSSSTHGHTTLDDETEIQQEQIRALRKQLAALDSEYEALARHHMGLGLEGKWTMTTQQAGGASQANTARDMPLQPQPPERERERDMVQRMEKLNMEQRPHSQQQRPLSQQRPHSQQRLQEEKTS